MPERKNLAGLRNYIDPKGDRHTGVNIRVERTMIVFQTGELTITTVDGSDMPALFEVYKQCEDFLSLGSLPMPSVQMVKEDINHSRGENGSYCAIREDQGRIIGVIDFNAKSEENHTSVLSLLMIAAPWRNKGYGQAVVSALEEYLRKNYETKQINSGVQTNNREAIRFWKRLGYQLSAESCNLPDGTVVYTMTKEL